MKNIDEVLQQKEARMKQLRVEIEALRTVAPMLGASEQAAAAAAAAGGSNLTLIPTSPRQEDGVDLSSFLNDVHS
ncbi:MAG TPA: hypothetical protein VFU27_16170 [Terriglobales bacterium]|nr:hypothetical protein [Terriglobales bacterium]